MLELPPLPYPEDALEPVISARTMSFHHGKHHAAYVRKTNALAETAGLSGRGLDDIIKAAASTGVALVNSGSAPRKSLYNNAAQAWNHGFFWRSMTPTASRPVGDLEGLITARFGTHEALKAAFVNAGTGHFGSGWLWLVLRGNALRLATTHDARNFVTRPDVIPLLVCDLWEHAYYLDHQNDRGAFLAAWFDQLANWPFALEQLSAAMSVGAVGSGSRR
jgi:Fe-Mn family superoxide dismutase